MHIVLGNNSLAGYPQGGGHWSCFLQYLLGLKALGHEVFWLEVLASTGNSARDQRFIRVFLARFKRYGLHDRAALLLFEDNTDEQSLERARVFGMSKKRVVEIARDADLLWNFSCSLRPPLLLLFKHRVLIDGDPGHLQVSALVCEMGIRYHEFYLTAGTKINDVDCEVPTLGVRWHPFNQFVHLPLWDFAPAPPADAPFSSVTQWTWEELWLNERVLSVSKRSAYLRYIDIPSRARRAFELAVNIDPKDATGDRELLLKHRWKLTHPHRVARTPASYRGYIRRCRAEFQCPKPIYRELKTGWFSDRSACFLASGRPVLAEDTGFSEKIPTGRGLLPFATLEEAVAGVEEIDRNYTQHTRAARELAEEYFSSNKWLPRMLAACGY